MTEDINPGQALLPDEDYYLGGEGYGGDHSLSIAIDQFFYNKWLKAWKTYYQKTVIEGNPQYEYDQRKLILHIGEPEALIDEWRIEALSNLPIERAMELLELYRTYVPRKATEKGKRGPSKEKIAKSDHEEGIVPVFGQLLPPKKTRKKKS